MRNGRFRPLSAHYLKAGFDASGQIDRAGMHRVCADRLTPFADPVRYEARRPAGRHADGRHRPDRPRRAASARRAALPRHRRARRAAARHRRHGQQVRGGFLPRRGRDQARDSIRSQFRLACLRAHRAAAPWSNAWRRWRAGAASATAPGSASPTTTTAAPRSPESPRPRWTARSGEIKVHNFWCALDCGVAVQPDNIVAQTESSLVYGLGLTLMERIPSRTARSSSRTSTITRFRA